MLTVNLSRKSLSSRANLFVILMLLLGVGCKSVDEKKTQDFTLPRVKMNEGAVALQVAVVQVDSDQQEIYEQFWARLDGMKLQLPERQIADKNGIRYAIMSPQSPAILDQLLERRELDVSGLTEIQKQMAAKGLLESPSRLLHHKRVENDTGETFEIPVSDFYQHQDWSIIDKSGHTETGGGDLARAFMQLSTFPQGDGSVRLVVEPEIHHGQPQQRYDVSQRTFLFSESQLQSSIDALKFSIDLLPGESLVVAPISQTNLKTASNDNDIAKDTARSIGDLFFVETPVVDNAAADSSARNLTQSRQIESAFAELDKEFGDSSDHNGDVDLEPVTPVAPAKPPIKPLCRFLMVRLIHTQASDLFDRSSSAGRLTTINHQ